jgi:hypothetical protein
MPVGHYLTRTTATNALKRRRPVRWRWDGVQDRKWIRSLGAACETILWRIDQVADQIVIVRFRDAQRAHLTGPRFAAGEVADVTDAVDFGCLRSKPRLPKQIRLFRWTLDQNLEFASDQALVARERNALLQGHQLALAVIDGARVDFAVQMKTAINWPRSPRSCASGREP